MPHLSFFKLNKRFHHHRKIPVAAFLANTNKEKWITEYSSDDFDLQKILSLADYMESIATISLNHCLYKTTGDYSKLTSDGNALTAEGQAFRDRVK